jgi:hypothetical protein
MRMLMALAFGCTLMIGVVQAASSGPTARGGQPPTQATPADEDSSDGLDEASQYICQLGAPLCQHASQCTDYCAGGTPVCFQGCCSCAS